MATTAISKTKRAKELGISRASICYRSRQEPKDWHTKGLIEDVLHQHNGYGHKRIANHLKLNKKRILRVMKKYGIKPYRRHGKKYRKSKVNGCVFPNLLRTNLPSYQNHIWASDFTHLAWKGKTIYLATILDIFTREIVGFSVMMNHGVSLVMNALLMAVMRYGRAEILHSDQGSEYTSKTYVDLAQALGIQLSMSRKASPWENGYQESWYDKCKIDLGDPNRFETLGEVAASIYQHIHYYNTERIHSKLRMAPKQYAMLQSLKPLIGEVAS
jgi:putative transposase